MKQVFAFEQRRRDIAPKKNRVWYYKWPDGSAKELKRSHGELWVVEHEGLKLTYSKLMSAKEYIICNGGEVWNELIDIKK